jgi:hypothetical protein
VTLLLRSVASLVVAIMCALGLAIPPSAAAAPAPAANPAIYVYDYAPHDVDRNYTDPERGPPVSPDASRVLAGQPSIALRADDPLARSTLARSAGSTTYDLPGSLVRLNNGSATTQEVAQATSGDLLPLQCWRVAAKSGLRAPQVLRVGDVKLSAVPKGAVGTPTQTGKGMEYVIPRGTPEISESVASVRIMDPVTSGKYQYPNGYAVYMNSSGQTINPLTGQTIANSNPFAHIPLP